MKKIFIGLIAGIILALPVTVFSQSNIIKIVINNQEITPDVEPRIIDGRVLFLRGILQSLSMLMLVGTVSLEL